MGWQGLLKLKKTFLGLSRKHLPLSCKVNLLDCDVHGQCADHVGRTPGPLSGELKDIHRID
jgi:hypothetical protein